MKRRDFIKNSALASTVFLVPGFIKAMDANISIPNGVRRLVIIQLVGGNDGLNTLVPYTNDIYYRNRPVIGIKPSEVIRLNEDLGFHPGLESLMPLYERGEMTVVNSVGYPNPNRSHFRSTDIWHTASSSDRTLKHGWIGSYLDRYCEHSYNAIEIGNELSLILQGKERSGLVTRDAKYLSKLTSDPFFTQLLEHNHDQHLSEHNMGYLYQTMIDARQSAAYVEEKTSLSRRRGEYGDSQFDKQLATIAQFINSGLDTRVYFASLPGFDTHANQSGTQSRLLKNYADAVSTFVRDLKAGGTFDDTLILTFSEFGRRVAQNAASGTDHGAANNIFVMGSKLKQPSLFNPPADLRKLDDNGDLIYDIDFRQVYANLLESWLGVPKEGIIDSDLPAVAIV